jgi:hypothetical protein
MQVSKIWLGSSALAALLMAWVSFLGITSAATYAKETANWAAQAVGQDYANLFLVFPLLLGCVYFLRRGSLPAYLFWLGTLIYMTYSYVLYSFFVHFGPNFLFYVAILGLSFYSLVGSLMEFELADPAGTFARVRTRYARLLLLLVGTLFSLLWLSDIAGALSEGGVPSGTADIGAWVNPIQVLDLAFLLPGALLTAHFLERRRMGGYIFAVPFLTFFAIMGVAIVSMFRSQAAAGFPTAGAQSLVMLLITLLSAAAAYDFLRGMRSE